MRKINLSNDTKRDAEVAFGTTFHRQTPVYKTADGKKSVNERRVRATMKTTDEACSMFHHPQQGQRHLRPDAQRHRRELCQHSCRLS